MKFYIYLIVLFISNQVHSNVLSKNYNLVISVDGVVLSGTKISSFKLRYIDNLGKNNEIEVEYYPGKLSIHEQDEIIISNIKNKELTLIFNYTIFCKNKMKTKRFEIDLNYSIICNPYVVLNVYTMQKNKKMFFPLEGKDYTFEYNVPNQPSMSRVTKKRRYCN